MSLHGMYRTSRTMSTFNTADVNVKERGSLMATYIKTKHWRSKGMEEKEPFHGYLVQIETSVPRDHFLASLCKASWCQVVTLGRMFLFTPHTMKDSYNHYWACEVTQLVTFFTYGAFTVVNKKRNRDVAYKNNEISILQADKNLRTGKN